MNAFEEYLNVILDEKWIRRRIWHLEIRFLPDLRKYDATIFNFWLKNRTC